MPGSDGSFGDLIAAIAANDQPSFSALLDADDRLVNVRAETGATRQAAEEYFLPEIGHYLYVGDTPLHLAAGGYRVAMIRALVERGGDVAARNRRGAQPLHYAVDGQPGSPRWDPVAQGESVVALLQAGADPNAVDKSGVGPLHRAVRTRSTAAVAALLEGGADPRRPNKKGSTPLELAGWTTGRGGSGSPAARSEQAKIHRLLLAYLGDGTPAPDEVS